MGTVYYQVIKRADGSKKYVEIRKCIYEKAIAAGAGRYVYQKDEESYKRMVERAK